MVIAGKALPSTKALHGTGSAGPSQESPWGVA